MLKNKIMLFLGAIVLSSSIPLNCSEPKPTDSGKAMSTRDSSGNFSASLIDELGVPSAVAGYPYRDEWTPSAVGHSGMVGCVNKKRCGMVGHPFAEYTKEGFCSDCEFDNFPERFIACLFCRRPGYKFFHTRKSSACDDCERPVAKLLVRKFGKSKESCVPEKEPPIVIGDQFKVERKFISEFKKNSNYWSIFPKFSDLPPYKLIKEPYLYRGAMAKPDGGLVHVWVNDIETDPADYRMNLERDEHISHLRAVCDKYNFFGPETGTLIDKMPDSVVVQYDEGSGVRVTATSAVVVRKDSELS